MTAHGMLHGSDVPEQELVWCTGGDWWAFLWHHLDEQCPQHGWREARTPSSGTDVSGPCLSCGTDMVLEVFNPDRHTSNDLRCPSCKENQR